MLKNSAKGNYTLEELGWPLHPPGLLAEWDGLIGWFMREAAETPAVLEDTYLRQWFKATLTLAKCNRSAAARAMGRQRRA